MKKLLALLLAVLLLIFSFSACVQKSDEEMIRDRIEAFLKAYNTGDSEGVLECLDAKTRNTFAALSQLSISFGGGMFSGSLSLKDMFGIRIDEEELLSVDIVKINISSETAATVDVQMSYKNSYQNHSEEAFFTMVKEDGNWFIKNFEDK